MPSVSALDQLNSASRDDFIALLEGLYLQGSWVVEQAFEARPFKSLAALKRAMVCAVRDSTRERKIALLQAATPIASKAVSAEEANLVAKHIFNYNQTFGFPFVFAEHGPRAKGLTGQQIISTIERRIGNHVDFEFAEALRNIHRQAEIRLDEKFTVEPSLGNQVWDWAEQLASDSDPGYAEHGQLTVTYLTDAHRAVAKRLTDWMTNDCGFDEVTTDAVGNIVGIYHGTSKTAKRLMTGSHYDTVRNAGKYDGRLGILVPMACVKALSGAGRRLPFGVEVVAFSEEEGQRYKAVFLGSGALTGDFNPAWLEQVDANGISMRQAMELSLIHI